jgi:hypothetical protein
LFTGYSELIHFPANNFFTDGPNCVFARRVVQQHDCSRCSGFLKVAHSEQDFLLVLVLVVVLACLAEAERRLVLETKGKSENENENDDEDDLVAAKGRAVPIAIRGGLWRREESILNRWPAWKATGNLPTLVVKPRSRYFWCSGLVVIEGQGGGFMPTPR